MRGVYWDNTKKRFRARPMFMNVQVSLGRYKTEQEASVVVEKWLLEQKLRRTAEIHLICEEGEMWLPLVGFESSYVVSSYGRIKNLRNGLLSPPPKKGYLCFSAGLENKNVFVHIAVAQAFLGYEANGKHDFVVDHIDGDKTNNRLDNLQIISQWWNTVKSSENFKSNKHCIQISPSGKFRVDMCRKRIGTFDTLKEAQEARDNFALNSGRLNRYYH